MARPGTNVISAWMAAVAALCAAALAAGHARASPLSADDPVLAEVIGNIRAQKIGDHTVGDLNLPDDFLADVADRIIRASFEEQFRIVVRSEAGAAVPAAASPAADAAGGMGRVPATPSWKPLVVALAIVLALGGITYARRNHR
jgi:hypothetical protein